MYHGTLETPQNDGQNIYEVFSKLQHCTHFLSPVKQNFRRSTVFETCTFSSNYSQSFSSKCRVKYLE